MSDSKFKNGELIWSSCHTHEGIGMTGKLLSQEIYIDKTRPTKKSLSQKVKSQVRLFLSFLWKLVSRQNCLK